MRPECFRKGGGGNNPSGLWEWPESLRTKLRLQRLLLIVLIVL
jgi:hypothetical protein